MMLTEDILLTNAKICSLHRSTFPRGWKYTFSLSLSERFVIHICIILEREIQTPLLHVITFLAYPLHCSFPHMFIPNLFRRTI